MLVQVIEVSYLREKQPKDYEKVVPAVKFSAGVEDGEDHVKAAQQLMTEAATLVHAGMGLSLPASIAKKLGAEVPKEETPKKAQTEPKKEEKPKEEKPKEETRQVTENPEDRKNPEDDAGSDEMPEGMDQTQLHAFMLNLVTGKATSNKKKLAPEVAKAVFSEYQIERVSDLPDEKVPEVWGKFNDLKKELEAS